MSVIKTEKGTSPKRLRHFVKLVFSSQIFEGSATLSYYFLFSIFPFLIFLSAAFATLDLDPVASTAFLEGILPANVMGLLRGFLEDIAQGSAMPMIFIGLALTVFSMGRSIETLKRRVRRAYRSDPKVNMVVEWVISLVFVLLLLVALYATLIVVVFGDHMIAWIQNTFHLSESWSMFHQLRLLVVGAFILFVLFGIYYILPSVEHRLWEALPGTLFAMVSWIITSWLFSYYVDHMNDYSKIYGSLGAIIVLLTWLYLFNFILLLGVQINAFLFRLQREVDF